MRFFWTATLIVGCLGAPLAPQVSKKVAENMEDMTQNRETPTMTTDGDVDPTNDGTVNNNVSFLRFC
ncbi:hypothetical protein BDV59DRAFT_175280 [Aspergillus ambiguus]|uniref:uncharacterized protein n=1 Tax=Aspergillus ambiguus TaxID=176160 RepID=UPI003CCD327C